MPRSKKINKISKITGDLLYNNKLLTRFINRVMRNGKKSVAQKVVYQALELVKVKKLDPITVFNTALQNVGPRFEVKPRRVGGASYQVPIETRGERKVSLAIKWIIQAANSRPNKQYHTFSEKLATELIDAYNNSGEAIKKRNLAHRNAEANRAFSHFRW